MVSNLSPLFALLLSSLAFAAELPIVNLGYQRHRAASYNASGEYYTFSGIRYAQPPIHELRWRAPRAPIAGDTSVIHDGSKAKICPQASAAWQKQANLWVPRYLEGKNLNISKEQLHNFNSSHAQPQKDDNSSEDCLFLDVLVPRKIFDAKQKPKAPVLVWLFGGGYVLGSSNSSGNPAGLIYRSLENNREGVIYVAINYRLGAFGWLGGPQMQSEGGVANVGLLDQRFALRWVQKYIHLFGGDPDRVTVFGESAGAGSIMHQITAYGGKRGPKEVPFQRAVLQSPGWQPQVDNKILNNQLHRLFELTNTTSLEQLRRLPSEKLIEASFRQIYQSPYSVFTYGPSVDGKFVPDLPSKLLMRGEFAKEVEVMTGHNSVEGITFTNPFVKTQTQFKDTLHGLLPSMNNKLVNYVAKELYPPKYGGVQNYTDHIGRYAKLISDLIFVCNTYYVDQGYKAKLYSYLFSVPPALHGYDVAYTYYNNDGGNPYGVVNTTVAIALQEYIITFAQNGKPTTPSVKGIPKFNMYGADAQIVDLGLKSISHVMDDTDNARCKFWQKALYD